MCHCIVILVDVAEKQKAGVSSDKSIIIDLDDYDIQGILLFLLYMEVLIFNTFISTCTVSIWVFVAFVVADVDVIEVQDSPNPEASPGKNHKKEGFESEADDADNAFVVVQNLIGRAQAG